MTFLEALGSTTWPHWRDGAMWLGFNLVGSLTPIWFGWLLLTLLSRPPSWADLSSHGEFALYSAAMLAPTLYILLRDLRAPGFPGRLVLGLLAFTAAVVSTGFFAAVTTAFAIPQPLLKINQAFLRSGTLGLFVFSALLAFVVTVVDNARSQPDIRGMAATQEQELAKDFEKLGGGQ
jgi:hypothetical protein